MVQEVQQQNLPSVISKISTSSSVMPSTVANSICSEFLNDSRLGLTIAKSPSSVKNTETGLKNLNNGKMLLV